MRTRPLAPSALAVAGLLAIVVGIYQGLVHVAPGYGGTIVTGWGRALNHEERLLAWLAAVGLAGTVGTLRWRRLAVAPVATGVVVLFYTLRAVLHYALDPGLYQVTTTYSGEPIAFVLGAEPFLLVAGGGLLVVAGTLGWRRAPARAATDGEQVSASPPAKQ